MINKKLDLKTGITWRPSYLFKNERRLKLRTFYPPAFLEQLYA